MTVEDPVEYQLSSLTQIQVESKQGMSFASALRSILRQDPDIIFVGEIRDLDTAEVAVQAALTGHLVLATLHTTDTAMTIDRILDVFPAHRQEEVKVQLSGCLQGIVSQQLLPRAESPGRVLAYEILIATPALRNLIREHATEQIPTTLQTGAQHGMRTMDACIKSLYDEKVISFETAMSRVKNIIEFRLLGKPEKKKHLWAGK